MPTKQPANHHYFFGQREPESLTERRFLECPELIEPVTSDVKRLVETRIEPPTMPSIDEMVECMTYMRKIPEDMRNRPFWRGMGLMQYFVYLGADKPSREPVCSATRYNIAKQIGFLSLELPKRFVEKHL